MQKNTSRSSKNSDLSEAIKEISNHLSLGLNKNNAKVKVEQVVEAILYRLKTSCQWRQLPIKQFFELDYSWNSVYQHFARWSRENIWDNVKEIIFEKYKRRLDLSSIQLDGSQSLAKRGGEAVG